MSAIDTPLAPAAPVPAVRGTSLALLLLTIGNVLLGLAITAPLAFSAGLSTGFQTAFALVAIVGYVGGLLWILGALFAWGSARPRARTAIRWVAPVLLTLLQTALFLDVRIYGMFRFHFNGIVWQTLTAPGGWDSLHIPTADLVALVVLVVLVMAVQRGLLVLFERRAAEWPGVSLLTWKRVGIAILCFGAADRATFAAFDLMRDYEIARAARVVPGYQRFTVRRFAKTWFGWEPGAADASFRPTSRSDSGLKYPVKPLTWGELETPPNVLWVVLESWRSDAFGPEHSPEIWEIGKKGHVFQNHVAGGNNTTFGVFSMFYGLYGSYRSAFLAENRGPVLVDRMRELDYRFAVYSSFPMTWPEFRKYTFVDIPDAVKDEWPHEESAKNDPLVIDELLSFVDAGLAEEKKRPFFGFLLLDSSHAPYTFPEEFGKFQPYTQDAKLVRYIDVTQRAPEMRNRYFNAVLWEDHQVGRLWDELEKRGLLENTAILITGDHGEEFNEYGFWTHSGGYTPAQVNVPAILYWPGREPKVISARTGHTDIAPTFLEGLGVQNPPSDYSLGHSLFEAAEGRRYEVPCGWRDCAVVDDQGIVVFGIEGHYAMNFDVLDHEYEAVEDPRAAMATRTDRMLRVMKEMAVFLE